MQTTGYIPTRTYVAGGTRATLLRSRWHTRATLATLAALAAAAGRWPAGKARPPRVSAHQSRACHRVRT